MLRSIKSEKKSWINLSYRFRKSRCVSGLDVWGLVLVGNCVVGLPSGWIVRALPSDAEKVLSSKLSASALFRGWF